MIISAKGIPYTRWGNIHRVPYKELQTQAQATKLDRGAFVAGIITYASPRTHALVSLMKPSSLADYANWEE